jgi:hypothetical protein
MDESANERKSPPFEGGDFHTPPLQSEIWKSRISISKFFWGIVHPFIDSPLAGYNVRKEFNMAEEAREQETKFTDQMRDWRNTATDKFLGLFPRRTAEHLVNAQKEGLLAVRSLLDRGIEILNDDLKRVTERPSRN